MKRSKKNLGKMNAVAKKSKSSKPKKAGEEMSGPQFPTEVWLTIFGFLDWENLQEKAVLVCNSWLEIIRGSPKLSGEMALKSDKIKKEDLIAILTRWKELKVLRAIQGDDFDFKGIKFSKYAPNLRQIMISEQLYGKNFKEFPSKSPEWFFSTIVCLDPQVTPKLLNSLQSLEKSKISPDSVKELALNFFGYDLAANLDEEGMFISYNFFLNFENHSDIINGCFKFQVCTLMIGLSNSLDHN